MTSVVTPTTLWQRIEAQPLELALAAFAVVTAFANMFTRTGDLSIFALAFYLVLAIGGVAIMTGLLTDSAATESSGLALFLGGYAFYVLRKLGRAEDGVALTLAMIVSIGIVVGISIRLHVVRKALRARRTARRLQAWTG